MVSIRQRCQAMISTPLTNLSRKTNGWKHVQTRWHKDNIAHRFYSMGELTQGLIQCLMFESKSRPIDAKKAFTGVWVQIPTNWRHTDILTCSDVRVNYFIFYGSNNFYWCLFQWLNLTSANQRFLEVVRHFLMPKFCLPSDTIIAVVNRHFQKHQLLWHFIMSQARHYIIMNNLEPICGNIHSPSFFEVVST